MKQIGLVLAWVSLLLAVSVCSAATLPLTQPCNIQGPTLPVDFAGTDIRGVIHALKAIEPKDDFETTSQAKTRITHEAYALANPIQCAIYDPYGMSVAKYDADHQRMVVSISYSQTRYGRPDHAYVIRTNDVQTVNDIRVVTDVLGVKRAYGKQVYMYEGLAVDAKWFNAAFRAVKAKDDGFTMAFTLPMRPDMARKVSDSLAVVIQYRWVPDYVSSESSHTEPSTDWMVDVRTTSEFVRGRITRIVIFDRKTGAILLSRSVL